jgi:hypothetical protein
MKTRLGPESLVCLSREVDLRVLSKDVSDQICLYKHIMRLGLGLSRAPKQPSLTLCIPWTSELPLANS